MYDENDVTSQLVNFINQNNLINMNTPISITGTADYPIKPPLTVSSIMERYLYEIANHLFPGCVSFQPNGTSSFPDMYIGDVPVEIKTYKGIPNFDIANRNFIKKLATGETIEHLLADYLIIEYSIGEITVVDEELNETRIEDQIIPISITSYKLWEMVERCR